MIGRHVFALAGFNKSGPVLKAKSKIIKTIPDKEMGEPKIDKDQQPRYEPEPKHELKEYQKPKIKIVREYIHE